MGAFESEKELIAACLKGVATAQWELYNTYAQAMYNTAYRYTCNHQDTQDILQNGFSRVFKHLGSYDPRKGELISWIRTIHIRCALDCLKKRQSFTADISEQEFIPDSQPTAWEHLEAGYILQFIEQLPPRDRVIFNLRHIEGYSHEEIAEMLSININSSRVYLSRAKKTLREWILAFQEQQTVMP